VVREREIVMRYLLVLVCVLALGVMGCADVQGFDGTGGAAGGSVTLTVLPGGNGTGSVTSAPAGIDCGAVCSTTVDPGTEVTLTASTGAGSTFVGWTGGGCSGTGACVVTVDADVTVQAAFALNNSLVVTLGGTGTGAVTSVPSGIDCGTTCSAQFGAGTAVTLTASPGAGSTFAGWTGGGCSGTGACVVTVDAAVGVTAIFTLQQYTLTVSPAGTGGGTVTSSPSGINCGGTCASAFDYNAVVTLTASPGAGSTFAGWTGGGCSGTGTCAVTVDAAVGVTAIFTLEQYTLTVSPAGIGGGTVTSSPAGINCGGTCASAFDYNAVVTLSASANGTSVFAGWSGGGCSGTGICAVTVTAATTVTATFDLAGTPPILYWALDGNGNNSGSTAGYALTLTGSTSYVGGVFGQALRFNSGSFGQVSGSARAVLGVSSQYTISFWVNASSLPTGVLLDFSNRSSSPCGGIQLYYDAASQFGICVASTSRCFLPVGNCTLFDPPASNSWHNVILRYAGTGTGPGQGADVDIYQDGVLVLTIANDANNDPVFNSSIRDTLTLGTGSMTLDDIRVYNTTFTPADQCTQVIGGTWNGASCALP
jgi:hypothetical protein